MGKKVYFAAVFLWVVRLEAFLCVDILNNEVTYQNVEKHVQYISFKGNKVPFLDLAPKGASKGSVLLVSGFSKNMNSWLTHAELLRSNGYRVILFDQSNVGRNLRENGIIDLKFGEGLSYDARLGVEVLKKLRPEKLILAGHSRGARVVAEIGTSLKRLRKPPVELEKIVLMSPYTSYNWRSDLPGAAGFYADSWTDFALSFNPSAIGRAMGTHLKTNVKEEVEGLLSSVKTAALGFILKGTKPLGGELGTLHFVEKLLENGVLVKVVVSGSEEFFTPLSDVEVLNVQGVDFRVLEAEEGYSHYWVEENLSVFKAELLEFD